jgi:hypothetical protein
MAREQESHAKLESLQQDIHNLTQSVAANVTRQVLAAIDSHPGTTQAITKSEMDSNLAPIIQALKELTISINSIQNIQNHKNEPPLSPGRTSPSTKNIRDTPEGTSLPGNGSPDRKKNKNDKDDTMDADFAKGAVGQK